MGCEGLNSLLRDPRYLNADDPEHKRVVAMVARAFELVFDETPENRRRLGRPEPDAFTRTLEQRVGDEAAECRLPRAERAGLGRALLVRALKQDGVKLPSDVPEREPSPPGPLARLGAPAAQRRNTLARPQAERPTTRRLTRTLLSGDEGRDDLVESSGKRAGALSSGRTREVAQLARPRTRSSVREVPPVPEFRKEVNALNQNWLPFYFQVTRLGLSDEAEWAIMQILAGEGGPTQNQTPGSTAFGGITEDALADVKGATQPMITAGTQTEGCAHCKTSDRECIRPHNKNNSRRALASKGRPRARGAEQPAARPALSQRYVTWSTDPAAGRASRCRIRSTAGPAAPP